MLLPYVHHLLDYSSSISHQRFPNRHSEPQRSGAGAILFIIGLWHKDVQHGAGIVRKHSLDAGILRAVRCGRHGDSASAQTASLRTACLPQRCARSRIRRWYAGCPSPVLANLHVPDTKLTVPLATPHSAQTSARFASHHLSIRSS